MSDSSLEPNALSAQGAPSPPACQGPLLSALGLHKNYRIGDEDIHVLQGANFDIDRGQWVAILGASGSGKSTLLHLLGGLDRPDQGQIQFNGHPLYSAGGPNLDRYRNTQVGFVFQFYHLLPELNVVENVLLAAMVKRSIFGWFSDRQAAHQRACDLLDRLGLSHRLRHRPTKLSGGERQRVAIARALINEPAVLLADEPTGNLDAKTGGQIIELLEQLHQDGQTIVMVTHDSHIAQAADRRFTLEAGELNPN